MCIWKSLLSFVASSFKKLGKADVLLALSLHRAEKPNISLLILSSLNLGTYFSSREIMHQSNKCIVETFEMSLEP